MTQKITSVVNKIVALLLALMAVLVFGNVIMRYFFHSGITWAEEVSRFAFIWLIFIGSIIALKDNLHLGVDTVVSRLSPKAKRILFIVNEIILLIILVMLLDGAYELTMINRDQSSPAINLPYAYVYVSGVIMAVAMIGITAYKLYRLTSGKFDEHDLQIASEATEAEEIIHHAEEQTGKEGGSRS